MKAVFQCVFLAVIIATASFVVYGNYSKSVISTLQHGEHLPGGEATYTRTLNKNAFSHPSANLSFEQELDFRVGNGIFKKIWVSAPASTKSSDGLGPVFNAKSCQRCHLKDGRGHPPSANWPDDTAVSMFLRLSIPPQNQTDRDSLATRKINAIPEPTYGGQLQDFAIQGHHPEGRMYIHYETFTIDLNEGESVELRRPHYSIGDLGYGPLHPEVMISPRIAPPMIGLGLLEQISAGDILANADPSDRNGDGISGRPNWSGTEKQLGRFGWKAGMSTLDKQNQAAFAGDIGISTPLNPRAWGDCTERQMNCINAPDGNTAEHGDVEVGSQLTELVLFYAQNLAVPVRRNADDVEVLKGKALFHGAGCADCHIPTFTTAAEVGENHLSGQKIWPYTDLLLHDMGEGLADGRPEGDANGREWRTPPLWGIGLTKTVNGHEFFLHDGRARGLLEAILWHGGEAKSSRDHVIEMSSKEREMLLKFVESL